MASTTQPARIIILSGGCLLISHGLTEPVVSCACSVSGIAPAGDLGRCEGVSNGNNHAASQDDAQVSLHSGCSHLHVDSHTIACSANKLKSCFVSLLCVAGAWSCTHTHTHTHINNGNIHAGIMLRYAYTAAIVCM